MPWIALGVDLHGDWQEQRPKGSTVKTSERENWDINENVWLWVLSLIIANIIEHWLRLHIDQLRDRERDKYILLWDME